MGTGYLEGGKLYLNVLLGSSVDEIVLDHFKSAFQRVSEMLFHATGSQLQIGEIYVAKDDVGLLEADVWIVEGDTTAHSINLFGIGTLEAGNHVGLGENAWESPFLILHELGHYVFGLADENVGPGDLPSVCTDDRFGGACIMEWGAPRGDALDAAGTLTPGTVREFCTAANHDKGRGGTDIPPLFPPNGQGATPCWETIKSHYPALTQPTPLAPPQQPQMNKPPAAAPGSTWADANSIDSDPQLQTITWTLVDSKTRFALALDASESMNDENAIDSARVGAHFWVDALGVVPDDELAIVAYNHNQSVITDLQDVAKLNAHPLLDGLNALGATDIHGAIERARQELKSPGNRTARQIMVLISDGVQVGNGANPTDNAFLQELVREGIRVCTVGYGPNADLETLQHIAVQTNGTFLALPSTGSELSLQNLQVGLIYLFGLLRDGAGFVQHAYKSTPGPVEEIDAWISTGATRAIFVLSHDGSEPGPKLTLRRPGAAGTWVTANPGNGVTYSARPDLGYAIYTIEQNVGAPHPWTMRVEQPDTGPALPFTAFAVEEDPSLEVQAGVSGASVAGEVAAVSVSLKYDAPLTQVDVELLQFVDPAGNSVEHGSFQETTPGTYELRRRFDKPGTYQLVISVENKGNAVHVPERYHQIENSRPTRDPRTPPLFRRMKMLQVHVGPLSEGKDTDGHASRSD